MPLSNTRSCDYEPTFLYILCFDKSQVTMSHIRTRGKGHRREKLFKEKIPNLLLVSVYGNMDGKKNNHSTNTNTSRILAPLQERVDKQPHNRPLPHWPLDSTRRGRDRLRHRRSGGIRRRRQVALFLYTGPGRVVIRSRVVTGGWRRDVVDWLAIELHRDMLFVDRDRLRQRRLRVRRRWDDSADRDWGKYGRATFHVLVGRPARGRLRGAAGRRGRVPAGGRLSGAPGRRG